MFGFLPHNLFTNHLGQNSTGLSPRLWSRVSGSMMESDGSKRLVLAGDDFMAVKGQDTYTDLVSEHGYTSYIDTGGTLLGMADEIGGALSLNLDGTGANDEIWLSSGDGTQQLGNISDAAADAYMTAFEARFKLSSITTGHLGAFIGLASPGLGAQNTLVDTTLIPKVDKAFIGFKVNVDDGDGLDFIYQAASQTLQTVIANVKTLTADTYVKVGFLYEPLSPAAKRIKVFVDNVEQATYVTGTNIAAATFPDAEALAFLVGAKALTEVAAEVAVDWWAFAQVIA